MSVNGDPSFRPTSGSHRGVSGTIADIAEQTVHDPLLTSTLSDFCTAGM